MTTAPFAEQQLTPVNHDVGGVTRPPQGMVVHTAVGSFLGTENWEHDAKSHISSFFVVAQDGRIAQEVDLDNKAWTQAAGNAAWIGVENEGDPSTPFTPAQIRANGQILAWLHTIYGVPLVLTTDPINGHGLGYHSMGGVAWSPAHHNCPGPIIVAQLGEILVAARAFVLPLPIPEEELSMLAIIVPGAHVQTRGIWKGRFPMIDFVEHPDGTWDAIGVQGARISNAPDALNLHGATSFAGMSVYHLGKLDKPIEGSQEHGVWVIGKAGDYGTFAISASVDYV